MDEQYMDDINRLNFEYVNLFTAENDKQLFEELQSEMLLDAFSLKSGVEPTDDLQFYYYVGKYGLFIAHFERNEQYQYCADILKMSIALLSDSFNISRARCKTYITNSINHYKEIL